MKENIKKLGKIASDLSEIINKRGWFTKGEKAKLKQALDLLNDVLARKIEQTLEVKKNDSVQSE